MVGCCFLCSAECSLVCPHCGAWVCGAQHYQYHRRLTAREAGDSPVPAGSDLLPDKLCQPFKLIQGDKVTTGGVGLVVVLVLLVVHFWWLKG